MFSKTEIKDLLISVLVVSLIFSSLKFDTILETIFIVFMVFITHELAHKFVAQHYGCFAQYKIWYFGILLGLITALIPGGIVFVAPGAVHISPFGRKKFAFRIVHLTRKDYGIISLSGPLTNVIIGVSFLLMSFFYPLSIFYSISRISFFLAFFNLIPFPPLDGSKVFAWDRRIWLVIIAISLVGLFL